MNPLQKTANAWMEYQGQMLLERRNEIRALHLAIWSKQHAFLLGEPGTGKSLLIDSAVEMIADARKFDQLIFPGTQPEEIFGPYRISRLQHDEYLRAYEQYLPGAHIAFLDEIWNGSPFVLNGMLKILNERRYKNGADVIECPLLSMFCGSNQMPQTDELAALADRLAIRCFVRPIEKRESMVELLSGQQAPTTPPDPFTLPEVERAHEEVRQVVIPDHVTLTVVDELMPKLAAEGVKISTRKWFQAASNRDRKGRRTLSILKASAWLRGATQVEDYDLTAFYYLWDDPKDESKVRRIVGDVANPLDATAQKKRDEATQLMAIIAAIPEGAPGANDQLVDANLQYARLIEDIQAEIKKAGGVGNPATTELQQVLEDVRRMNREIAKRLGVRV